MEKLKIDLGKYRGVEKSRKTTEWQELAQEIGGHYKVKAYGLVAPWRSQLWYVRQSFEQCRKDNKPFKYFMSFLKTKTATEVEKET